MKTLELTYQANYNGWGMDEDDTWLTKKQVKKVLDILPDLTYPDCDDDGEYGYGEIRNQDKIEKAVKKIVGKCKISIEIDSVSS